METLGSPKGSLGEGSQTTGETRYERWNKSNQKVEYHWRRKHRSTRFRNLNKIDRIRPGEKPGEGKGC